MGTEDDSYHDRYQELRVMLCRRRPLRSIVAHNAESRGRVTAEDVLKPGTGGAPFRLAHNRCCTNRCLWMLEETRRRVKVPSLVGDTDFGCMWIDLFTWRAHQ